MTTTRPMKGSTFKRCSCRDPDTGRLYGSRCPDLRKSRHGSWHYQLRASPMAAQIRRGGYPTQAAAAAALEEHRDELLHPPESRPSSMSTGEWLRHWLAEKERAGAASAAGRKIAATTARGYRVHIESYLIPVIGEVPLTRLTPQDVSAVFASLTDGSTAPVRPLRPASVRRVYATLRSALNVAVKQQHLERNPALLIHLDSGARPKALVWTSERVALWKETGKRPSPVMVWTPDQTGAFLDSASDDPLYALYHLVALRGLRRGEAVGLSWSDVDLDNGVVLIREQVVQLGWRTQRTTPKAGSERMIALDTGTTQVLRAHRDRQDGQLRDLGLPRRSVPYVFTRADGELVHPNFVTRHFAQLIAVAELPPIRLHDLRHGAATLALAAGTDMKVVQEMLGHSSITITADTYTSVLPEMSRAAAQAAANLIPRRRSAGLSSPPGPA